MPTMISVPVIENSYMLAHGTRAGRDAAEHVGAEVQHPADREHREADAGRRCAAPGARACRVVGRRGDEGRALLPPDADADAVAARPERGLVGHRDASLERRARSNAKAMKATA